MPPLQDVTDDLESNLTESLLPPTSQHIVVPKGNFTNDPSLWTQDQVQAW